MSSKPRLMVDYALYQVRSDSVRAEKIFPDDCCKNEFFKLLRSLLKKHRYECYVPFIGEDHYNLALKTSDDITIDKFMRKLNSPYARFFNKKEGRGKHGAVFSRPYTHISLSSKT